MAILNLEDLKPGMVLASEAKHLSGRVLLAAGVELTEKHLKVFHTWGLTEADIEGVDIEQLVEQQNQALDPAIVMAAEKQTTARFCHTDQTCPAVAELFRLSVRYCAKQLAGKE